MVSCFCIESDGMPVRRREAGQVGVKGIVMFSFPVSVCVCVCVSVLFALFMLALFFFRDCLMLDPRRGGERVKR